MLWIYLIVLSGFVIKLVKIPILVYYYILGGEGVDSFNILLRRSKIEFKTGIIVIYQCRKGGYD